MDCLMFPGQPLSRLDLFADDADFACIAGMMLRITGFDLERFDWSGEEGSEQVKLQLFGVAASLYRERGLRRTGVVAALAAEHSMGVYAALAACGALREDEAIELTWRIGRCLAGMGKRGSYGLGCVIGLAREPLLNIAQKQRGVPG